MPRERRLPVAPKTLAAARQLRRPMTPAEKKLWRSLRSGQMAGLKFRRQHPVGPYVADFCCMKARLIVEVDGDTHAGREAYDGARTAWLDAQRYRVVRFTNFEIYERLPAVLDAIRSACESVPPPPQREGRGEGEVPERRKT